MTTCEKFAGCAALSSLVFLLSTLLMSCWGYQDKGLSQVSILWFEEAQEGDSDWKSQQNERTRQRGLRKKKVAT